MQTDPMAMKKYLAAAMSHPKSLVAIPMTTVMQCPDCGGSAVLVHVIVDETLLPAIPLRCIDLPSYCPEMHHVLTPLQVSRMEARIDLFIARVGEYMLRTCGDDTDLAKIAREDEAERQRQAIDFRTQYAAAQEKLDREATAREAEDVAWAMSVTDGEGAIIPSYDALLLVLTDRRKAELGRGLAQTETARVRKVAAYLWNVRSASRSEVA